jgi:hypothetical protein
MTEAELEEFGDDSPPEGLRVGLPWERVDPGMSLGGMLKTSRMLLCTPAQAFDLMRLNGPLTAPLVYLVALGTLGTFFGLMWQSWARAMLGSFAGGNFQSLALTNSFGIMSFVLAPFVIAVLAIVATGIHHLFLLVFGGAPRPVEVTLRVVCYAWGASYVWMLIPACGGLVATVWGATMTIVGLRVAHRIPGSRAAAAVIVPYLTIGCCVFILWMFLATATLASVQ